MDFIADYVMRKVVY